MRTTILALALLTAASLDALAQVKRTEIPLGSFLAEALASSSLTRPDSKPFHIRIDISEPENPQSPYQGSIEEWWSSPQEWRREVAEKSGMRQVIVYSAGVKSEEDTADYFPNWLRRFVTAVFDPVPDADEWNARNAVIKQTTLPNGMHTDPCVRSTSTIGSGDHASTAYSTICFDGAGHLKFVGSPGYSMEFHDISSFNKRQIPHNFIDNPESGTRLVGAVNRLEDLSKSKRTDLFQRLARTDNLFQTAKINSNQLETLCAPFDQLLWPRVRSGNLRGHVALYLATDRRGRVHEAWPLAGDNGEIQDFARTEAVKWALQPVTDTAGQPLQMEGAISLPFETAVGDPLPELSDAEVRALAITLPDPNWPASVKLPHGTVIKLRISVNEQGKLTGSGFGAVPQDAFSAVLSASQNWTFRPLIRDGKPQYFHGDLIFIIP